MYPSPVKLGATIEEASFRSGTGLYFKLVNVKLKLKKC